VIGGVEREADDQRHDSEENDAGKNVHDLQFTYLVDTTLYLAVRKISAGAEPDRAEEADKPNG